MYKACAANQFMMYADMLEQACTWQRPKVGSAYQQRRRVGMNAQQAQRIELGYFLVNLVCLKCNLHELWQLVSSKDAHLLCVLVALVGLGPILANKNDLAHIYNMSGIDP